MTNANKAALERAQQMQHLHAQIAELEAEKEKLKAEEAAERSAEIRSYAEEIKDVCADAGWELAELIAVLAPKKARKSSGTRKLSSVIYRDPDTPGNVYRGRGMPVWLREKMIQRGYDPSKSTERARFREEVLIAEAA